MRFLLRGGLCAVMLAALFVLPAGLPAGAAKITAVEGLLLDAAGHAAPGYGILLLGADGTEVARATTDPVGYYRIEGFPAGSYSLGIENPEGKAIPVAAPAFPVREGKAVRRDLRLTEGRPEAAANLFRTSPVARWWAGLSPKMKAATGLGAVVGAALIVSGLDNQEEPASPFQP